MITRVFNKYFFLRKNLQNEINKEREQERKLAEKEHIRKIKDLNIDFDNLIDILESSKNAEIIRLKKRVDVLEEERRKINALRQYALKIVGESVNITTEIRYHYEQNAQTMSKTFTLYNDLLERADSLNNEATKKLEHI